MLCGMDRRTFTLGIIGAGLAGAQEKKRNKPNPSKQMFSEYDVRTKIKQIIVEQLGVKEKDVTDSARFLEDLKADSLDVVELVMAFEEAFGIEIPDETAEKMLRVSDAIAIVKRILASQSRLTEEKGKV